MAETNLDEGTCSASGPEVLLVDYESAGSGAVQAETTTGHSSELVEVLPKTSDSQIG